MTKKAFVIETNLLIVANGNKSPQADNHCILACIQKLLEIKKNHLTVIDNQGLIIGEYQKHNSFKGEPGVGDKFFKWINDNKENINHCEKATITEISENHYAEFPIDPNLANFDLSDRKFVAVAIASKYQPTILNAVDSDWSIHDTVLKNHGLKIEELCPNCLKTNKKQYNKFLKF